nr:MAG TPA: hypothetical protein [Caudoviricetes sp.]
MGDVLNEELTISAVVCRFVAYHPSSEFCGSQK